MTSSLRQSTKLSNLSVSTANFSIWCCKLLVVLLLNVWKNIRIKVPAVLHLYSPTILQSQMFFMDIFHHKRTHSHFYYTTTTIPQGIITILCLSPWGHLDNTTLNRCLGIERSVDTHDLHNLAERLNFYYDNKCLRNRTLVTLIIIFLNLTEKRCPPPPPKKTAFPV